MFFSPVIVESPSTYANKTDFSREQKAESRKRERERERERELTDCLFYHVLSEKIFETAKNIPHYNSNVVIMVAPTRRFLCISSKPTITSVHIL